MSTLFKAPTLKQWQSSHHPWDHITEAVRIGHKHFRVNLSITNCSIFTLDRYGYRSPVCENTSINTQIHTYKYHDVLYAMETDIVSAVGIYEANPALKDSYRLYQYLNEVLCTS